MDELQRFVSEQNISRFVDQLRRESKAVRQNTLKRLLIEEENRFAAAAERLQVVDKNIVDGAARIASQARVVSRLKSNGHDAREAERTLQNFEMIQGLFISYRTRFCRAAEP
jgi:fructose-bisphosphate aldolase class 1